MKCSNPDCTCGIGLIVYRRDWFSKRRYCSSIAVLPSWIMHQSHNKSEM